MLSRMERTPAERHGPKAAFAALGISGPLLEALVELGYEEPTPIQLAAIPPLLAGRDVLGQAATGTGKTAAFALPLLHRLESEPVAAGAGTGRSRATVRALVLVPTRELAIQVAEALHRYGRALAGRILAVYGGQPIHQQLGPLRHGVDVVVATPGRALDHLRRGSLVLDAVEMLVLDEADEMLDMGFADDLEAILEKVPAERQAAFFSATLPRRITALAERHLRDPARIAIATERAAAGAVPRVRHVAYVVQRREKIEALARVLDLEHPTSTIVFCRTRTEVDELAETLGGRGYHCEALHGGRTQEQRTRVMRRFRDGTIDVLIATDVAARGLDIEHVSHVINFDVPCSADVYVHRVGRTGRAGRTGVALTFAEPRERRLIREVERVLGQKIRIADVPTVDDVRARRLEVTAETLRAAVADGELDVYRALVAKLATDLDPIDLASAALKLVHERGGGHQRSGRQERSEASAPSETSAPDRVSTTRRDAPAMRSREGASPRSRDAAAPPRTRTFTAPPGDAAAPPRTRTFTAPPHDAAAGRTRPFTPPSTPKTRTFAKPRDDAASTPRIRTYTPPSRDAAPTARPRETTARSARPSATPIAAPPMNRRERRAAARAVLAALAAPLEAAAPPAPAPSPAPPASAAPARKTMLRKPRTAAGSVARLRIGLGSQAGLRPADVVGAIANEAGLTARQIGAIAITDQSTTVEVPASEADAVVRALGRTTIRGRRATIERVP